MAIFKMDNWLGVSKAVSKRGNARYLEDAKNFDTNLEVGELVSRKGYASRTDVTIDSLDIVHNYRDAEWGKDVLLAYEKDGTTANRRLWLFTKTLGASGNYSKVSEHSYGTVELGNNLHFLQHRNTVRVGTGTGANNKALFAGYIDRTGDNGMFDTGQFDQANFYLLKSQWVEQATQFNGLVKVVWDSVNSVYYCLTFRGVEIRDAGWNLTRVLNDVTSWAIDDTTDDPIVIGDLDITTLKLVAVGKVPNSTDTKIVIYDLLNDYDIVVTSTKSSPEFFHHCAIEGSTLWITYDDGTDGHIAETGLVSPLVITDRYGAGVGDQNLYGLTTDGTYVYVMDNDNQRIIRMEDSGAYGTTMYAHGVASSFTNYDIYHSGGKLFWLVSDNTTAEIYETATATFNAKSLKDDWDGSNTLGLTCSGIASVNSVPMVFSPRGVLKKYDDETNWNDDGFVPGKAFINAVWVEGSSHSSNKTYFYGFSFVDIYGQESHLMSGGSIRADIADKIKLTVYLNAESELYQELTSPSQDPASDPSIWGMYRRIKKVNLWRAESSTVDAKEPSTEYTYLDSIEIDSSKWTLLNPSGTNYLNAYYVYVDSISDISSVTFEETTGIPENFKPYYTNWQYAIEHLGRYYFGNVRTDDLYEYQFIQSEINAPDMNWQTSTNIELFYPGDGDEIKGFGTAWNRLVVFKGEKCAIYSELTREQVFGIGLQSPRSVLAYNNQVFFLSKNGFYVLTPSGYKRISQHIDADLENEVTIGSDLSKVSVALFEEKFKIWWHVSGSKSYLLNLNIKDNSWNVYDLNHALQSITNTYIIQGIDGKILATSDGNGKVYEQNTGFQDDGNDIDISLETKRLETAGGMFDDDYIHIFLAYSSPSSFTLVFYQINDTETVTTNVTNVPSQTFLRTEKLNISGWGQAIYYSFSTSINTSQFSLKDISVETMGSKKSVEAA